jgi:hypothetical protein
MLLTDKQNEAIARAIYPLDKLHQDAFIASLRILLADRQQIGDGELFRLLRELQKIHMESYPDRTSTQRHLRGKAR